MEQRDEESGSPEKESTGPREGEWLEDRERMALEEEDFNLLPPSDSTGLESSEDEVLFDESGEEIVEPEPLESSEDATIWERAQLATQQELQKTWETVQTQNRIIQEQREHVSRQDILIEYMRAAKKHQVWKLMLAMGAAGLIGHTLGGSAARKELEQNRQFIRDVSNDIRYVREQVKQRQMKPNQPIKAKEGVKNN